MQQQDLPQPQRPTHMPELAERCLHRLAESGLSGQISLGGALGLLHYLDYRATHDVDAWWADTATQEVQDKVLALIEEVLREHGEVRRRAWGDVTTVELIQEGKVTFSFQIARRSAQLKPSVRLTWIAARVDSLDDLVASKMVALVERGAPRDFRDIYEICRNGLRTPAECWQLWRQRQALGGADTDAGRARLAIETHLERIARHRPLASIEDQVQRAEAEQVRRWFAMEFLDALVD